VEKTLQAVLDVAGVGAAIVLDGAGRIICHCGHPAYDRSVCEQLVRPLVKAIDTVQLEQADWETISARYADGRVLVRSLGDGETACVLAVVADATLSISFATVAIRVAANRLKKVLAGGVAASSMGLSSMGLSSMDLSTVGASPVGSLNVGSPNVGSPNVGSPNVGSPNVGSPNVGSPNVGSPNVGSPNVGSPSVGSPSVGSPSVGSPSVGSPSVGSPSVGSPSVGSPDVGSPNGGMHLFSMSLNQAVRRIHKYGPIATSPPSPPSPASAPRPLTPTSPPACAPGELERLQEIARDELGQYAQQALEILSRAGPSQSGLLRAVGEVERMIRLFVNRKDAKKVGHRMRAVLGEQTR
jgi:hypothetical protein